jgi:hypothetical protein
MDLVRHGCRYYALSGLRPDLQSEIRAAAEDMVAALKEARHAEYGS